MAMWHEFLGVLNAPVHHDNITDIILSANRTFLALGDWLKEKLIYADIEN